MAEIIKLTISPTVASYVRPGTPLDVRQSACSASENMSASDHLTLLFCLSKDTEPTIRVTALSLLKDVPVETLREYIDSAAPHPLVLNALRSICHHHPETGHNHTVETAVTSGNYEPAVDTDQIVQSTENEEETEPIIDDSEQFLSKYKTVQLMGIAEKIKMALSGDKEWRAMLVKDPNKLVSGSVIKNPRITEAEILTLVKSGIQNDEIMRLICANKEWIKSYNIRKALIENSRTPVQNAMRYLGTMTEKDLSYFAKSKNVASVVSTMAKRMLLNKKK